MPQLTLQPDGKTGHIWVTLDGQRLVCLRNDDREVFISVAKSK